MPWMSSRTSAARAQRRDVAGQIALLGPRDDLLLVERDERDGVGPAVAEHHGLRDPARLLELVLEVGRRDVLAARRDDDVLLAARDAQVAVLVEGAEVARVEPAVLDRPEGLLRVLVVALEDVAAADEDLAVIGDLHLAARDRPPDGAELVVLDGRGRGHGGRLGHPVALEHRRAARVEELEDLVGDGRRAGRGLAHAPAERGPDLGEQRLVGLVERGPELVGDRLAALLEQADLHAHLHGLAQLLGLGVGGDQRVDLLEDPRDRREVGRPHLGELGDDLLRVLAPVGDGVAEVEAEQLDEQRVGVGQGEVEVDDLARADPADGEAHVHDGAVVAVGEHAALGRTGRARGVDEGERVLAGDRVRALAEGLLAEGRAAGPELVEREGGLGPVARVHDDQVLEGGEAVADLEDLGQLLGVLADDGHGLRVAHDPGALLGGVGLVDRHHDAAGGGDGEVDVRPLGPGVGEDADAVAGRDAEIDEAAADLGDDRADLGEGDVVPRAIVLVAHGDGVGMDLGRAGGEISDRLRAGRRDVGRGGASLHANPPRARRRILGSRAGRDRPALWWG